jgi:hypothetical protein
MLSSRCCMTPFKPRFGGAFFALRSRSAAHLNQSPALRGSVRLRITHTRQTRTDNIGERPRALLSRGVVTGKRGIAKPEPIMRPRLYNIAQFRNSGEKTSN